MELIADTKIMIRGKLHKIRIVKFKETYAVICKKNIIKFSEKGEGLAELLERIRFEIIK